MCGVEGRGKGGWEGRVETVCDFPKFILEIHPEAKSHLSSRHGRRID